jgi:hypothetical protein
MWCVTGIKNLSLRKEERELFLPRNLRYYAKKENLIENKTYKKKNQKQELKKSRNKKNLEKGRRKYKE